MTEMLELPPGFMDDLVFTRGNHPPGSMRYCLMEAIAFFMNVRHSDNPPGVSQVMRHVGISANDNFLGNDSGRTKLLKPLMRYFMGTKQCTCLAETCPDDRLRNALAREFASAHGLPASDAPAVTNVVFGMSDGRGESHPTLIAAWADLVRKMGAVRHCTRRVAAGGAATMTTSPVDTGALMWSTNSYAEWGAAKGQIFKFDHVGSPQILHPPKTKYPMVVFDPASGKYRVVEDDGHVLGIVSGLYAPPHTLPHTVKMLTPIGTP